MWAFVEDEQRDGEDMSLWGGKTPPGHLRHICADILRFHSSYVQTWSY